MSYKRKTPKTHGRHAKINPKAFKQRNAYFEKHKDIITARGHTLKTWGDLLKTELYEQRYDQRYKDTPDVHRVSLKEFNAREIKAAADKLLHSTNFVKKEQIVRENIINSSKKFDAYNDMRRLIGERDSKGRFRKIDLIAELSWDSTARLWSFMGADGKRYVLDTTNSPEEIFVREA